MLNQRLQQKLMQKLSPQQIQLMRLIQLPTQAFEQKLKQEIEENPALESGKEDDISDDAFSNDYDNDDYESFDSDADSSSDLNIDEYLSDDEIPNYRLQANNYSSDDEEKSIPFASEKSFTQYLQEQLNTFSLSEKDAQIAEFLVGSIDDSGYLRRSVEDIVDDLAFSQNISTKVAEVNKVLNFVQQLDPVGVGARDLKECLLLQLKRKTETPARQLAITLLTESFDEFVKKHFDRLIFIHQISEDALRNAIKEIACLNPKPGGNFIDNAKSNSQIIPDFTITIEDNELVLQLHGLNSPELHISSEYQNLLKSYQESSSKNQSQKEAVFFVKQKLDAAKWFIDAVIQRQHTLYVTMNAIMNYQKAYFLTGDEQKLRPMILKDIAEAVKMDISTISRVANSKYVDTPYGTKLIKQFFSESMKNDQGDEVSTKEIKKILHNLIEQENKSKPLADGKLAELLLKKGYPIARRTVAKYREQLDLPVARLRKIF